MLAKPVGRLRFTNYFSMICLSLSLLPLSFAGCERKEKILDVKTPGGDVEVERSLDTGRVDVDVDKR